MRGSLRYKRCIWIPLPISVEYKIGIGQIHLLHYKVIYFHSYLRVFRYAILQMQHSISCCKNHCECNAIRYKRIFIFCDISTLYRYFSDGVCNMFNIGDDSSTGNKRLFRSFSGLANVAANGPVSASAPYTEK